MITTTTKTKGYKMTKTQKIYKANQSFIRAASNHSWTGKEINTATLNLNMAIKMKQYVLFKITDKFVLLIKGNIKKPEFNLKKRKLFNKKSA